METYRGAGVSSRLSDRKRDLIDQGIEKGHKPGCIHLYAEHIFELNQRTGHVTDFGIRCGCTKDSCHNCGNTVEFVVKDVPGTVNYDPLMGPSVPVDYDPELGAKYQALLERVEELEGNGE